MDIFNGHKKETGTDIPFCGFYWHSTRLARAGTDFIFNESKPRFQLNCTNNMVPWEFVREELFQLKKTLDQKYRNMLWHFAMGDKCTKCLYWDNVYQQTLANVDTKPEPEPEVTDQEMLELAMEIDGAE